MAHPVGTVWRNWAGTESARPARVASPASVEELQEQVASAAGLRVRMVGSGHSFTAVAVTDGLQLRPDRLTGIVSADLERCRATVLAGTTLRRLGPALARLGLAMPNLGDIDVQTLAGALSTGTHGTGGRLGGLASQVAGLALVLPDGSLVTASRDERPDLFDAARVGLGAFGVLATVTLQCVPAFALRAVEGPAHLDAVLDRFDALVQAHDHVEFYWFPHTRRVLLKRDDRLPAGEAVRPLSRVRAWLDDDLLSNTVYERVNRLTTRLPRTVPVVNALSARALTARDYSDASYRVLTSTRRVVFREMEYALPRAALPGVLAEVRAWLARRGERVGFPVEVRVAAADDAWLSTAYRRDSAYIAVHQYHRRPHARWFGAVEAICLAAGGRPHWGKLHGLAAADLRERYPRFDDARRVRAEVDPEGVFGNPYLDRVLGPAVVRLPS